MRSLQNQVSPGQPERNRPASPWGNTSARPAPRCQWAGRRGVVTSRTENFLQSDGLNPPPRPKCGADSSQAPWPDHSPAPLTVLQELPDSGCSRSGPRSPTAKHRDAAVATFHVGWCGSDAVTAARPAQMMTQNVGAAHSAQSAAPGRLGGSALLCWTEPACERRGARVWWALRVQRVEEAEVAGRALSSVSRRTPCC